MSQAGIVDFQNSNPQVPTQFDTDSGSAIPIANTLEIIGSAGVTTSGSGNTVTISLTGGGAAIDSITVDAFTAPGTNPVIPDGFGLITVTGAQAISGTVGANVIRSNSLSANAYTMEIQQAGSAGVSTTSLNGVAHFNNTQFTVSNGFVSLTGGGLAIDSIAVQTGSSPIVPTAGGLVNINGAVVAAGTNPVRTDGTGANTMDVEVQISQALAATDATKIGLSNFNSAQFSVDANGFVSLAGGGLAIDSIHPDSGTDPIVPTASGLVNIVGSGSVTTVGSLNTLTAQLTGLTNHSVLVGAGTATITKLAVGTNGQVLIASTAADPAFATITSTGGTIAFTLGANTLNMDVASGGFTWTDVTTATQAMLVQNGYITDRGAGVVYTLPATAALGSEIIVMGKLGITTITPNANQQILMSSASGTVGVTGTIVGTNVGDCVTLIATTSGASTVWRAKSFVGNWTVN